MSAETAELHVVPELGTGGWIVGAGPEPAVLSRHATANEAERAARRRAGAQGARRIFLHDRYQRVRPVAP